MTPNRIGPPKLRKVVIPPGAEVYCLLRHRIGMHKAPIRENSEIRLSAMAWEPGQERNAGQPQKCKICGNAYRVEGYEKGVDGYKKAPPRKPPTPPRGRP